MQGIVDKMSFGLAEWVEGNEFFEPLQIRFANIDHFVCGALVARSWCRFYWEGSILFNHFADSRFDVLGDFRKRGAGVSRRKLEAVILRGVMAGGEVDRAVQLATGDLVSNSGCGGECIA